MKYLLPIIILVLFGCKKFDHQDPDLPSSCPLCEWADGLEGSYSGTIYRYYGATPTDTFDTTINLTHIFLNQNPYQDSTVMYFHSDYPFSSNTLVASDSSGSLIKYGDYGFEFIVRGDSLEYNHWIANPYAYPPIILRGVLYK